MKVNVPFVLRLVHSFGPKCWPSPGEDDQTV